MVIVRCFAGIVTRHAKAAVVAAQVRAGAAVNDREEWLRKLDHVVLKQAEAKFAAQADKLSAESKQTL